MLHTPRLLLKVGSLAETPLLLELNSDPEVVRYTGDTQMFSLAEAEEVIRERMIPQFRDHRMGRFSVYLNDGPYLGWCGLKFHPETNEVDLGYRFMKRHWGKGYATEASQACLEYGFEVLGLETIIAKAAPDNLGSMKVLQKLGMSFKGHGHDPTDPLPFVRFELTAAQYRSCRG